LEPAPDWGNEINSTASAKPMTIALTGICSSFGACWMRGHHVPQHIQALGLDGVGIEIGARLILCFRDTRQLQAPEDTQANGGFHGDFGLL
jgi:hypothetical protein